MSRLTLMLIAAGLVAPLALAAEQKSPTTKPDFNATYGVLSERNMFLRERKEPRKTTDRPRPPTVDLTSPEARERQTVLRGVTIEANELHAYLENTRNNQIIRVAPGDKLVNGTVVEIALDAIAYSAGGKTAWIEIGQNLAGVHTAAGPGTDSGSSSAGGSPNGSMSSQSSGSSASSSAASSTPLPAEGGSIEERMKARRARERGAK